MEQPLFSQQEFLQGLCKVCPVKRKSSCSSQYTHSRDFEDLVVTEEAGCPVKTLKKHELLVYETFIHEHITPGFRYKVRENGSNKRLFGGEGRYLEQVGQGYGRRLTFESENILENENFFWTDSNVGGYAFSADAVAPGETFIVKIGETEVGFATVSKTEENQEIVSSVVVNRDTLRRVKVNFECKFSKTLEDTNFERGLSLSLQGIVTLSKKNSEMKSKIEHIDILSLSGTQVVLLPTSMN